MILCVFHDELRNASHVMSSLVTKVCFEASGNTSVCLNLEKLKIHFFRFEGFSRSMGER